MAGVACIGTGTLRLGMRAGVGVCRGEKGWSGGHCRQDFLFGEKGALERLALTASSGGCWECGFLDLILHPMAFLFFFFEKAVL